MALKARGVKADVDVGKVACVLARTVYFGHKLLKVSTVYGKRDLNPLNYDLLEHLIATIHSNLFSNLTITEFNDDVRPKIITALSGLCRHSRH